MFMAIAEDFIRFNDTVLPFYLEFVEATKKVHLYIAYDLYRDEKDPKHFIFIEEWPVRAALDAHCTSEHFTRLVPLIDRYARKAA